VTARIGVDIGGTKIAVTRFDAQMNVAHEARRDTPGDYESIVAAVARLVHEAGDGTVGLGAPGSNGPRDGLWRNANIVACNGRPFFQDLERAIGRPIRMENDANCVALCEAREGAGKGASVVAFFTIGTGLGGGLVIGGKVMRGANGEAAEFGHTGLPWMDEKDWPPVDCFCGKRGCAEMYVSGTGLVKDYARSTGHLLKGPEIVARARAGEAEAGAAIARMQDRFARICANLVNVIDPDVIVMGGGMSALPELVEQLPPLIRRYSFSGTAEVVVKRAAFGEASGMRGAALLWAPA